MISTVTWFGPPDWLGPFCSLYVFLFAQVGVDVLAWHGPSSGERRLDYI